MDVDSELYIQCLRKGAPAYQWLDVVDALTPPELTIALDVVARYRDLELGLSDVSLVVLASRWRTRRILTLDERAFRAVTPLQGGSFEILPADG